MARGEISITCNACGYQALLPIAALGRDLYYCSRCGQRIKLSGVRLPTRDENSPRARQKPKRPYRGARRR